MKERQETVIVCHPGTNHAAHESGRVGEMTMPTRLFLPSFRMSDTEILSQQKDKAEKRRHRE